MTKKTRKDRILSYDPNEVTTCPFPLAAETARRAACEGTVLLRNRGGVLPLAGKRVSVFGRTAIDYVKSGTGSGGLVHVPYVINIIDGLREKKNITLNEELVSVYEEWRRDNPFDEGAGWGLEPWSQVEMPVSDELAARAAAVSDIAVVVFGRTAGEDRDNTESEGSFCASKEELEMLGTVRRHFAETVVVLNVGNIVSGEFSEKYDVDAVLYVWQGGMEGGRAVADVLTGDANPSGKLADTIARTIEDYPACHSFGDEDENIYAEDIYVGYRYFETFRPEAVLWPFGFGLSYTAFDVKYLGAEADASGVKLKASVTNIGERAGKEVVQLYVSAPQGKLGKPVRELKAYEKTSLLSPGESETLTLFVPFTAMASYDDTGKTGYRSAYVLEAGEYKICLGTDVRSAEVVYSFTVDKTRVTEQCTEALAPVKKYKRMIPSEQKDGKYEIGYEDVPLRSYDAKARPLADDPHTAAYVGDMGYRFSDYLDGRVNLDTFISQLSDADLVHMTRGEGMNSQKVTPGTCAAFGGLTPSLRRFGIPLACCTDGPSGIRLDSGALATSIPNGTLLACTWNKALVEELYAAIGMELVVYELDLLLGPGVNIHRHPLNGRNFEYFSEDPYLAGTMAAYTHRGLNQGGVGATVKHFSANSQEISRRWADSIASERAYREIYLKPYEIAVRSGGCYSIMTSYNRINGIHAPINYDLCTLILRDEWGYDGIVMTDWWPNLDDDHKDFEGITLDMASMIRAQNDLYMVVTDTEEAKSTTEDELAAGRLTRGQLVRTAKNICRMLARSNASVRDDCRGVEYEAKKRDRAVVAVLDAPEADRDYTLVLPEDGEYALTIDTETVSFATAQNGIDCAIGDKSVRFTVGGNAQTDRKTVTAAGGEIKIRLCWQKEQLRVKKLIIEK